MDLMFFSNSEVVFSCGVFGGGGKRLSTANEAARYFTAPRLGPVDVGRSGPSCCGELHSGAIDPRSVAVGEWAVLRTGDTCQGSMHAFLV